MTNLMFLDKVRAAVDRGESVHVVFFDFHLRLRMTSVIGNPDAQFVYFSRPSAHGLQYKIRSNGQTNESGAV